MAEFSKPMMPSLSTNPLSFIKEVRDELMKVTWPTRDEVVKLTVIVVVVSLALGIYIGGLDSIMTKVTDVLIAR